MLELNSHGIALAVAIITPLVIMAFAAAVGTLQAQKAKSAWKPAPRRTLR
jgi:hypothetical protein